jgi:hypothetical protein
VFFNADRLVLDVGQALCVALPAAGLPAALRRLAGPGWALVAPVSLVLTIAAVGVSASSADAITWIALVLVPIGCALALGWAVHGARPALALATVPLLAPDAPVGELARLALIVGSCATVGRLLAAGTPLPWLKIGVIAMATIDAVFIFGHLFPGPNAAFDAAVPAAGLPQLHVADFGAISTDYGDFFVAGVVGAILAVERRNQLVAAAATLLVAQALNQLLLVVRSIPETLTPALVLVGYELWRRLDGEHAVDDQQHAARHEPHGEHAPRPAQRAEARPVAGRAGGEAGQ